MKIHIKAPGSGNGGYRVMLSLCLFLIYNGLDKVSSSRSHPTRRLLGNANGPLVSERALQDTIGEPSATGHQLYPWGLPPPIRGPMIFPTLPPKMKPDPIYQRDNSVDRVVSSSRSHLTRRHSGSRASEIAQQDTIDEPSAARHQRYPWGLPPPIRGPMIFPTPPPETKPDPIPIYQQDNSVDRVVASSRSHLTRRHSGNAKGSRAFDIAPQDTIVKPSAAIHQRYSWGLPPSKSGPQTPPTSPPEKKPDLVYPSPQRKPNIVHLSRPPRTPTIYISPPSPPGSPPYFIYPPPPPGIPPYYIYPPPPPYNVYPSYIYPQIPSNTQPDLVIQ